MSEGTGQTGARGSTSTALAATAGENLLVSGGPLVGKRAFVVDVATQAAAERDVLVVTAAANGADVLPRRLRESPRVAVVDCSPGSTEAIGSVSTVGSPADLTGVSMPVSKFLADAESPVVVVDSISTFLLYADTAPVFRFLSVLTSHVRGAGGLGLYTIDDDCQSEETFRTFVQLFDGEVGVRADEGADETPAPADSTAVASPRRSEVRVRGVDGFDGEWHPS